MGKRMAERFDDDDFNEPNYDKLSDEELDELYNYGEIRSASKPKNLAGKKVAAKKISPKFFADEDDWLDADLDGNDLYEDD